MDEPKRAGIDALRVLGAAAIVWFHLHLPGDWIAMAALHVFVILAVHFGADRPLSRHASRLLIPWALWSALYGLAKIAQALAHGTPILHEFAPFMLLTGPSVHLWFLPFTFAVLALIARAPPLPGWAPPVLMLAVLGIMRLGPYPAPAAQWAHVLPAAVLGLWMASRNSPLIPLGLTAAAAAALWAAGFGRGIEQTALAALACLAAFVVPLPGHSGLRALAAMSFGVYLAHPLIVAFLLEAGMVPSLALFGLAFGASLALSAAIRHFLPFSRKGQASDRGAS